MPRVVLITEGGWGIGYGHVARCRSLYEAFQESGAAPEFILRVVGDVGNVLHGKKSISFDWLEEREKLLSRLEGADVAVVDSYRVDLALCQSIAERVKVPVFLDDDNRIAYPKGVVINGGIGAEALNYPATEGVHYLLGCRYAPLRAEFRAVPPRKLRKTLERILITFGGDDVRDLIPRVLALLVEQWPEAAKMVVVGQAFRHEGEIRKAVDPRTTLFPSPDAEGMKEIMLSADAAVAAGGQTLYELARTGVPPVVVAIAENQLLNIQGWRAAGFIEYAGWWEEEGLLDRIASSLRMIEDLRVREERAMIGRALVDGNGSLRVAEYVLKRV